MDPLAIVIHDDKMSINEVPLLWRRATRKACFDRYGGEI